MDRLKVILLVSLPTIEATFNELFKAIPLVDLIEHDVNNTHNALGLIYAQQPDIIILENDFPGIDPNSFTQQIRKEFPSIQVIIIAEVASVESVRLAMRAGACDFISHKNLTAEELSKTLEHARQLIDEERSVQISDAKISESATQKPAIPLSVKQTRVVAIYGPRGGAGTSTITANLAWALSSRNLKVLVVDGDFLYGDMGVLLNQQSNHSIIDLVRFSGELEEDVIQDIINHGKVDLLAAPTNVDKFAEINGPDFGKILKKLAQLNYDYLLINTSSHLSDPIIFALEFAESIIVVGTQEISSLRATRLFLDLMEMLLIAREKLVVVINRFEKDSILTLSKYQEFLKINISQTIPYDHETVLLANNLGIPFIEDHKNKPVGRAIDYLTNMLVKGESFNDPGGVKKVLNNIKSKISKKKP